MTARRGRAPGAPRPEPWKPAEYDPEDAAACQAVAHGRASPEQQVRAYRFILEQLALTYDLSYRSELPLDTAFAEGKRFVGLQMVKFANINLQILTRKPREQGETPAVKTKGENDG